MSFDILPFVILLILLLLRSSFTKERLAKLKPSDAIMGFIGCYVIGTTILDYVSGGFIYWYLFQCVIAISLIGYAIDAKQAIPSWKIGRRWLISVVFCLPVNVLWNWSGVIHPPFTFTLALSVAHLAVLLCVLPLMYKRKASICYVIGNCLRFISKWYGLIIIRIRWIFNILAGIKSNDFFHYCV